jgi:hypothetical protein
MHAWQWRRIDLTKLLKNACGILFQMQINAGLTLLMSKESCVVYNVYQINSSDIKCYWSDGLVKNALFDNILYTINKFYFDIGL